MAQSLDEKDVPNDGQRFAVLTPAQYYKLLTSDNIAVNRDVDGIGSVSKGTVPMVAGIKLFKSQHLADLQALGAEANQDQDDDNAANDVFGGSGTGSRSKSLHGTIGKPRAFAPGMIHRIINIHLIGGVTFGVHTAYGVNIVIVSAHRKRPPPSWHPLSA